MNNDYLSIGEMAKMNHITVTTLRLYDELDLLKPVYVNPETNYRYYDIKQNARLDLIQYMKELQMNLKEIKELLDKEDINLIEAILIKKKQQLSIQINDLQRTKDAISRTIYSLERYRKSPPSGTITLEYIDRRRIYVMHTNINFYEHDLNVYVSNSSRTGPSPFSTISRARTIASRTAMISMPLTTSACMLSLSKPAARRARWSTPVTSPSARPVMP